MSNLLPLFFMLLGTGTVVYGVVMLKRARESESWPSVAGEITRSEVRLSHHHTADGSSNRLFKAAIEYTYGVAGRRYRSRKIAAGGLIDFSWRGPAEERCARYPVGREVEVYYRPGNPRVACLEHSAQGAVFIGGVGAIFAVVGLFSLTGIAFTT